MPAKPPIARALAASFVLLLTTVGARAELSPFLLDRSLKTFSQADKSKSAYLRLGAYPSNNFLLEPNLQMRLDDQLAVILPLGVIYSVRRNVDFESAVSWELGLTAVFGWSLSPHFDSYFRKHLTPRVDFEVQLEYGTITPFTEQPTLWSLGLSLNWRYHFNESLEFVQFAQMISEDALMKRLYPNDAGHPPQDSFHVVAPVGIGLASRIGESSSVGLEYSYRGLGLPESVRAHLFNLSWRTSW